MSQQDIVLSMKNITKRFTGTIALDDVSINLYRNEILAVMGENGAGKSTLMKVLSGSYSCKEYEGTIICNGDECKFYATHDSENAGIAMIHQELNLELDLSVAENIMLGRLPKNNLGFIDWKKTKECAKEALDMLKANIDVNVTVRSLSPSMQQLVSIARALVRKPKILILDEPTSVLTEGETKNLMVILRSLKKQGLSCIYISHKLAEVFELCDRIDVMRDGRYINTYFKSEGYNSENIISDMIGRKLDVMYPTIEKSIGEEIMRVENFKVPHPYAYGKNIIEDVSFTLKKGEIVGLGGLVGAGRSELINAIFGVIPKIQGKVFMEDKEINIKNPWDAKSYGIGLLTEDRKKNGFIYSMSIKENMTLTIIDKLVKKLFIDKSEENKKAKSYYDALQVKAPNMDTLITSLSGGNQQKVILAKWLITNLKVLFLDEPTRGIDVGTKSEIYKLIGDLAKKGISIVMISSELPELIEICDRVIVLANGRVMEDIPKKELSEVRILRSASNT
ncbi:sugar ABC transporter ATP-binding protein [Vallitalea guaymasensis]|nr:sugar ABC transporter ATP-binding protein [Vallitalea guaymasensis]